MVLKAKRSVRRFDINNSTPVVHGGRRNAVRHGRAFEKYRLALSKGNRVTDSHAAPSRQNREEVLRSATPIRTNHARAFDNTGTLMKCPSVHSGACWWDGLLLLDESCSPIQSVRSTIIAPETTGDCNNVRALATPIRAARQQRRRRCHSGITG